MQCGVLPLGAGVRVHSPSQPAVGLAGPHTNTLLSLLWLGASVVLAIQVVHAQVDHVLEGCPLQLAFEHDHEVLLVVLGIGGECTHWCKSISSPKGDMYSSS